MRTHLNEATATRLLEVMQSRGFISVNHTINVLVSEAHERFKNHKPTDDEVLNNNGKDSSIQK